MNIANLRIGEWENPEKVYFVYSYLRYHLVWLDIQHGTQPQCSKSIYTVNLREKLSPEPGFEPGTRAFRAGVLTHWATQMIHWAKLQFFSIRDGGEYLCWHYFN